MLKIFTLLCSC